LTDLDKKILRKTFINIAYLVYYLTEFFGKMKLKVITGIALTVFLLSMLTFTSNVQLAAADGVVDWWPMFRHDLNHMGYSTSTAPNTNNTI